MEQRRDHLNLKRRNRLVSAIVVTIIALMFVAGFRLIILK